MKHRLGLSVFLAWGALWAHPMGNFSVSHYSRIQVTARGAAIRYVLDLAEIPTFELQQKKNFDATAQAREWAKGLKIEIGGRAVTPQFVRATAVEDKGAGGMPVLRVSMDLLVDAAPGTLRYEDRNYPDRTGWKEIVVTAGADAALDKASPEGAGRSQELTAYPQDPLVAPPQDLQASAEWHATTAPVVVSESAPAAPGSSAAPGSPAAPGSSAAPVSPAAPSGPIAEQPGQSAPGMVVKGDFLSRLLHQGEIGWGAMLLGMVVAFGLGSVHALSPGHGKTIVAAYLVGSHGTPKHAAFLGAMVTFTHTISVFALGLTTLFLSKYVLPEKIYPVLGAISGISIVWIGTTLLFKRIRAARGHAHHHQHGPFAHGHVFRSADDGRVARNHPPVRGNLGRAFLIQRAASDACPLCLWGQMTSHAPVEAGRWE
jgi:nickel/cobalt exporter